MENEEAKEEEEEKEDATCVKKECVTQKRFPAPQTSTEKCLVILLVITKYQHCSCMYATPGLT